jgi:hypothetical protein
LFFALRINQVISKSNLPSFPFEFAKGKKEEEEDGVPQNLVVVVHDYTLWRKQQHLHFADSFIPITLFLLQSW